MVRLVIGLHRCCLRIDRWSPKHESLDRNQFIASIKKQSWKDWDVIRKWSARTTRQELWDNIFLLFQYSFYFITTQSMYVHSTVLLWESCRLSVSLSVRLFVCTLVDSDSIHWDTRKLISPVNRVSYLGCQHRPKIQRVTLTNRGELGWGMQKPHFLPETRHISQ